MAVVFGDVVTLDRNWGQEVIAIKTPTHACKILVRKAGTKGGFQCHVKEESHYLAEGRLLLRHMVNGKPEEIVVEEGTTWTVEPLTLHQEEALTDCVIVECSDPTLDDRWAIEPDPGGLPSMDIQQAMEIAWDLQKRFNEAHARCSNVIYRLETEGFPK